MSDIERSAVASYATLLRSEKRLHLQDETKLRWQQLCEQAAVEQDPDKLFTLIKEINDLLDAKEKRLQEARARNPLSDQSK